MLQNILAFEIKHVSVENSFPLGVKRSVFGYYKTCKIMKILHPKLCIETIVRDRSLEKANKNIFHVARNV